MRTPPKREGFFCVAVIVNAHGIKGEVMLKSFTEVPEDFTNYGDLVDAHGSSFVFTHVRAASKGLIARIQGISNRNDAEALRHSYIYASEDERPQLNNDDAYLDDLIGMPVEREDGSVFGTIKGHFDNGAQLVLVIKHPESGQKDILIPFIEDMIDAVDHDEGVIVVTDFAEQMADINS